MFADKHTNLASHQASSSLSSQYKSPGRPIQLLLISHNKTATHAQCTRTHASHAHTHTHLLVWMHMQVCSRTQHTQTFMPMQYIYAHPQTGNPQFMISPKGMTCLELRTIQCHHRDCCKYKSKLKVQEAVIFQCRALPHVLGQCQCCYFSSLE